MQLDLKERLQLIFQLKILEKLYPEEKGYYANHRKAIEDGYELHYAWITENLSEGLSSDECTFVLDVLDLYSYLYFAIDELRETTKLTIDFVKFPGFDGNNEIMYMAYTKYFIEDLGRYDRIKEVARGKYNSHMRMIPKYKKMLLKWNEIKKDYTYKLTEKDVLELINIKGHSN